MTCNGPPHVSTEATTLYEIRVRGVLDQRWRDFSEGMTVEVFEDVPQGATVLRIAVQDQAALAGLMDALFGINATVLSVVAVEQ